MTAKTAVSRLADVGQRAQLLGRSGSSWAALAPGEVQAVAQRLGDVYTVQADPDVGLVTRRCALNHCGPRELPAVAGNRKPRHQGGGAFDCTAEYSMLRRRPTPERTSSKPCGVARVLAMSPNSSAPRGVTYSHIPENPHVPRTTRAEVVKYLQSLVVFGKEAGESIGWTGDPTDDPKVAVAQQCLVCGSSGAMFLTPMDGTDAGRIDVTCLLQCGKNTLRIACREAGIHLNKRPRRGPSGQVQPGPETPRAPAAIPSGISEWAAIGEFIAREHLSGRYVYDNTPHRLGWWNYDGRVWRSLVDGDPRLLDDVNAQRYALAQKLKEQGNEGPAATLAGQKYWDRNKAKNSDFWSGLRLTLAGDLPEPEPHYLGTPGGVVDLRTGQLHPHAPEFGIRALTRGQYLPQEVAAMMEVWHRRFDPVFAPEIQAAYLALLALALTRRAQNLRGIVFVKGESGSGKGGAVNVAVNALGDYSGAVPRKWLDQRNGGDIDATGAELLEKQPAIVSIDEVGQGTRVDFGHLMTVTGDMPYKARRPHGPLIEGRIQAQFWTTAVDVPQIPKASGIDRRMAVLPTIHRLEESEIDAVRADDQDLLAYVVTRAALLAQLVYQDGYRAPVGDESTKAEALADMDPLATWLDELPESLADHLVSEVLDQARKDLGDEKITANALGRRINASKVWISERSRRDRRIHRRALPEEALVPEA